MNKLIRFYNQNRTIFWIIVVCIVLVIALVQALNGYYKNNKSSSVENDTTTYNTITEPIIKGDTIKENTISKITNLINSFINYCNNGEVENAYNILSEDCKDIIFSKDINNFKNDYYSKIFTQTRMHNLELWISNNAHYTYRVEITEDILATGGNTSESYADYYTVVNENGEYKLNIMNYIGKETINKNATNNQIEVMAIEKYVYIDYEIYKIKLSNNTNKTIMLDSKEKTKTVYIKDKNNVIYTSFLNEITKQNLMVLSGMSKEVNIKFNKPYGTNYSIKNMVFTDVVTDTTNNEERIEISLDI